MVSQNHNYLNEKKNDRIWLHMDYPKNSIRFLSFIWLSTLSTNELSLI